jgi:hypothetical protein
MEFLIYMSKLQYYSLRPIFQHSGISKFLAQVPIKIIVLIFSCDGNMRIGLKKSDLMEQISTGGSEEGTFMTVSEQ